MPDQSGRCARVPCQMSLRGTGAVVQRAAEQRLLSCETGSSGDRSETDPRSFDSRPQSNQVSGLSWQYALLFPSCVRPHSSPISSIGTPWAPADMASAFFICRCRSAVTAGSSVGPSTPQFQE